MARSTREEVAARLGVGTERVAGALAALEGAGRIVLGEFRPGGSRREWCDADVLRAIRRRSLAALRSEIEPVDAAALGRFLPEWQSATRPRTGPTALLDTIAQLQGASIPASILESEVLAARVQGYRPADLDALCASGDFVWTGAGGIASDDGRVTVAFRDRLRLIAPPPTEPPEGPTHDALRRHLEDRGASFWPDLLAAAGVADERAVLGALWDLVWAGEVTNDTLAPLRAYLLRRPARAAVARPRPGTLRRAGPPAAAGRWSLVASLLQPAPRRRRPRTPGRCSSWTGTASSPGKRCWRKARRGATPASTGCSGRSRNPARSVVAISWTGSARRSSPCRGPWTGSVACARRRRRHP